MVGTYIPTLYTPTVWRNAPTLRPLHALKVLAVNAGTKGPFLSQLSVFTAIVQPTQTTRVTHSTQPTQTTRDKHIPLNPLLPLKLIFQLNLLLPLNYSLYLYKPFQLLKLPFNRDPNSLLATLPSTPKSLTCLVHTNLLDQQTIH